MGQIYISAHASQLGTLKFLLGKSQQDVSHPLHHCLVESNTDLVMCFSLAASFPWSHGIISVSVEPPAGICFLWWAKENSCSLITEVWLRWRMWSFEQSWVAQSLNKCWSLNECVFKGHWGFRGGHVFAGPHSCSVSCSWAIMRSTHVGTAHLHALFFLLPVSVITSNQVTFRFFNHQVWNIKFSH